MRTTLFALLMVPMIAVGCGKDSTGGGAGGGGGGDPDAAGSGSNGETPAFTITSKDVTLQKGEELHYAYFFHTPNTSQLAIKKWISHMTEGSHHMIMYWGSSSQPADGTLQSGSTCPPTGGTQVPLWVYASQTPDGELDMPADDGAGKPLGMLVPPNQPACFDMHYLNSTDGPLTVHVSIEAYKYDDGVQYTPTAAYVTYNANISIPDNSDNLKVSQTCSIPSGVKFWTVSTHAHKQAVMTELVDGSTTVFSSTDWEHPGAKSWASTPFYTFASGAMTYNCYYTNHTGTTIVDGPSASTNEMCMGTGYIFPADHARFCFNGTLVP